MERIDETINSAIFIERGMGTGHAESSGESNSPTSISNTNQEPILFNHLNQSVTSIVSSIAKIF